MMDNTRHAREQPVVRAIIQDKDVFGQGDWVSVKITPTAGDDSTDGGLLDGFKNDPGEFMRIFNYNRTKSHVDWRWPLSQELLECIGGLILRGQMEGKGPGYGDIGLPIGGFRNERRRPGILSALEHLAQPCGWCEPAICMWDAEAVYEAGCLINLNGLEA